MPKKLAVEYTCDRCGRVWYEHYEKGSEPPDAASLELTMFVAGGDKPTREFTFEAVCPSCYQTLINLADGMRKLEKQSPKPRAKKSAPKGAVKAAQNGAPTKPAASAAPATSGAARSTGPYPSNVR